MKYHEIYDEDLEVKQEYEETPTNDVKDFLIYAARCINDGDVDELEALQATNEYHSRFGTDPELKKAIDTMLDACVRVVDEANANQE